MLVVYSVGGRRVLGIISCQGMLVMDGQVAIFVGSSSMALNGSMSM